MEEMKAHPRPRERGCLGRVQLDGSSVGVSGDDFQNSQGDEAEGHASSGVQEVEDHDEELDGEVREGRERLGIDVAGSGGFVFLLEKSPFERN